MGTSKNLPRTVALHPAVLGEGEALELLAEVLDHVVTLGLTVDKEVEANFLLESDNKLNLLLDEILVLGFSEFASAKASTSRTNLLGLLCNIV